MAWTVSPQYFRAVSISALVIAVYQLGLMIPLPYVDEAMLRSATGGAVFGRGSGVERISVFALGLMPYVSAYFLVEVFSLFTPGLKGFRHGGYRGRQQLKRIALILTFVLGVLQAFGIIQGLETWQSADGLAILDISHSYEYFFIGAVLVAGVFALLIMAECISKFGVGHGISILLFAGVCRSVFDGVNRSWGLHDYLGVTPYLVAIVIIGPAMLAAVFLMKARASLPMRHVKLDRSISVFQFNFCPSGNLATTYAASLIMLPVTLFTFFEFDIDWLDLSRPGSFLNIFSMSILTAVLSYIFSLLFLHPERRISKLVKRGWIFDSVEDYSGRNLSKRMYIYNLPWTFLLILLSAFASVAITMFAVPFYIGGSAILLCVAVGLDIHGRFCLDQQLPGLEVHRIAEFHDVYDAAMIKAHLKSEGIACHLQGFYHRHLYHFLGPHIEMSLLVAAADEDNAVKLIADYHGGLGLVRQTVESGSSRVE